KPDKLPLFMCNPLSDYNVFGRFISEASASSSASSRQPVILLQKLSHTPDDSKRMTEKSRCGIIETARDPASETEPYCDVRKIVIPACPESFFED
ncbi:MAG: hypothetical protein AB1442_02090, partial [Nitrospirota bacterium]